MANHTAGLVGSTLSLFLDMFSSTVWIPFFTYRSCNADIGLDQIGGIFSSYHIFAINYGIDWVIKRLSLTQKKVWKLLLSAF